VTRHSPVGTDSERATTTEEHTMKTNNTPTTEVQQRTDRARPATTMGTVDQTHPDTNETFGFAVYGRGIVADGGRDTEEESMQDVDHESDTGGTDRIFQRGKDSADE
jgi:hypothetical protein